MIMITIALNVMGGYMQAQTSSGKADSHLAKQATRLYSEHLFSQGKEIIIEHETGEYRLRLTSNNKLILTK